MRKTLLTFVVMMLATAGVMAQSQFGVRAGFNVTTVNQDVDFGEGAEEPWRPGFNVGLASQFRMSEVFAIAPELLYTQRGYLVEYGSVGERNVRYDYLNLPVMFRLTFGDILKGYINAGPTFGYLLSGKYKVEGEIAGVEVEPVNEKINFNSDGEEDWDLDANRFEIGGAIGGGVMLDTEGGSFLIDLRYSQGFTNVANFEETDGNKNQAVTVSLIYLVPSVR